MDLNDIRQQMRQDLHLDESALVAKLLEGYAGMSKDDQAAISEAVQTVIEACRQDKASKSQLDAFIQEYDLSNEEGILLLCLSEALPRIPDAYTTDAFITDKLSQGRWFRHLGQSSSLRVNGATIGLSLARLCGMSAVYLNKIMPNIASAYHKTTDFAVRLCISKGMGMMAKHYVLSSSLKEATGVISKVKDGALYSFDMLGEGARTHADAEAHYQTYKQNIVQIPTNATRVLRQNNEISVKISAIYPKYRWAYRDRVMEELLPKLHDLCVLGKQSGVGITFDAEEASRLDLSCDLFESLARSPELAHWDGLGFVLQAYQKRAPALAEWLIALAGETERKIAVRLVKGAYWDYEVKLAQEQGYQDYPVFTRKVNSDLCYQYCMTRLFSEPERIYPQIATHNIQSAVFALTQAAPEHEFEFQRLFGMGAGMYKYIDVLSRHWRGTSAVARIYAPVGNRKDLVPYLVRRLLENGSNNSFINKLFNTSIASSTMVDDITDLASRAPLRNARIPIPRDLYESMGDMRKNSWGIDLDCPLHSGPLLKVIADGVKVPKIPKSDAADIESALENANAAFEGYAALSPTERAGILNRVADLMEERMVELVALINAEAHRVMADGISEAREAIDFCRYYANLAKQQEPLEGGGRGPRGVFFCISPWNFPLAIFTGPIAAALAVGNTVIAKPAEQTPAIAAAAVALFYEAGLPDNVLTLLVGSGSRIGKAVLSDPRIAGVVLTGSNATAQIIAKTLAQRPDSIPFIAETGGLNCMIADSTILPEHLVDDIIESSFRSAGQRCSSLRVLYLQEDIADHTLKMLAGALQLLNLGDPKLLSTDISPLIDAKAYDTIIAALEAIPEKRLVATAEVPGAAPENQLAPQVYEIPSIDCIPHEIFGPVLFVVRYQAQNIERVLEEIDRRGYGLTFGVHSRIDAFTTSLAQKVRAGNIYINRNTVGAVVGVHPFGGRGLSGTGPKAGGPHYLKAFQTLKNVECSTPVPENSFSLGGDLGLPELLVDSAFEEHLAWNSIGVEQRADKLYRLVARLDVPTASAQTMLKCLQETRALFAECPMAGPTGEENRLVLSGRGVLLVIADQEQVHHTAMSIFSALLCGCSVLCATERPASQHTAPKALQDFHQALVASGIPENLLQFIPQEAISKALLHQRIEGVSLAQAEGVDLKPLRKALSDREAIIPLIQLSTPAAFEDAAVREDFILAHCYEKTISDNVVAKGGNADLFNLSE